MKNKDWIYSRDLDLFLNKGWKIIMNAFIKNVDKYLEEKPQNFYVSYIKDKYGFLRMEYSGGDEYLIKLMENIEDLSYYM